MLFMDAAPALWYQVFSRHSPPQQQTPAVQVCPGIAVQDCILITDTGASGTIFQDLGFCVPNGLAAVPTPTPTATPASAPPPPYHSTIFSTTG